jgi:nucleoside-diphosphate-sugar epimerase
MANLVIGCGYLGEFVAAEWRDRGEVFVTTRSPERAEDFRNDYTPVVCDVLRPEMLRGLPQAEQVLYAIGYDRTSGASMREVYVQGLANVLDHLPRPRRLIYVSSTSVYGKKDGSWVDEDSPTEPLENAGRVVLEAERLLRERCPEAIVLRFAGIYGPDRLLRLKAVRAGDPIGGEPDRWLNLIHVFDGVEAVLRAAAKGRAGRVYNVADGYPGTRRLFYTELARLVGAPEPRFVPAAPDQPRPAHDLANRRVRNDRMRRELGVRLRFPSYEEGLSAIVRWMREGR